MSCLQERRSLPFDSSQVYSQAQFARRLGKSYRSVERWRIHGVVARRTTGQRVRPAFFVAGGGWRITGAAANEFVAALTPDVHDDPPADPQPRRRTATQERLAAHGF